MSTCRINIIPLPAALREFSEQCWGLHPPIFDRAPKPEDCALALDLIEALDPVSRRWYASSATHLARLKEQHDHESASTSTRRHSRRR